MFDVKHFVPPDFRGTEAAAHFLPHLHHLLAQGGFIPWRAQNLVANILEGLKGIRAAGNATGPGDRKSTRLNSSHVRISYAVFCLKKKNTKQNKHPVTPELQ